MAFHNELKEFTLRISSRGAPSNDAKHCDFIADRHYLVTGITYRFETGGSVSTATATVYKAPSGTTIDAGTALHSSVIDLTAAGSSSGPTASINGTATLSAVAGALNIAPGDAIGVVWGANMASLVGVCIMVKLKAV